MSSHEIDINKRYIFPEDTKVVFHKEKILVITPSTANWIVLESQKQLEILYSLKAGASIAEVIRDHDLDEQNVAFVVTQLEAKRLCSKQVHRVSDDKRNLHLYLTNRCNLRCPHCYMLSGMPMVNELKTEEILSLLSSYRNLASGNRVTISGGEPSVHKDFELIIEEAGKLGLEINLITNGSVLDEKMINNISSHISSVQVSIDGFSEESNSTIRGKGHFLKALNTIDSFLKKGVPTSVAITPTLELLRGNVDNYASFASELIARYVGKPFRVKFAEGLSSGRNVSPTKDENEEYAGMMRLIQKQVYSIEYGLIEFVETMRNDVILDNCMFGALAVASNGDVFLCPEIGELKAIANIRRTNFKEIFDMAHHAEDATTVSNLRPCSGCELMYICGGGCRIKEFPELSHRTFFDREHADPLAIRECNSAIKERFYDMLIESNEYLYKEDNES